MPCLARLLLLLRHGIVSESFYVHVVGRVAEKDAHSVISKKVVFSSELGLKKISPSAWLAG